MSLLESCERAHAAVLPKETLKQAPQVWGQAQELTKRDYNVAQQANLQAAAAVVPTTIQNAPATQQASPSDNRQCSECGKHFLRCTVRHFLLSAHKCGAPGCDSKFATRSNMLRHRRLHGPAVCAMLEEQEKREAAAAPTPIIFNTPIVNEGAEEGGPGMDVQWMAPNQATRPYTRYPNLPPDEGGSSTGGGSSSQQM
ncbi:hypothetical protein GGF50DRAFT_122319 [Schizophyllum commune]